MAEIKKTLDQLYVATPCKADWDTMLGTDQVRFCNQCQLNVYNISAMTRKQAEKLLSRTEGGLCTKLYRRVDGTIITKDCPVGFRAVTRKASRTVSAVLSALLGLFTNQTIVWADDGHKNCKHYTTKIVRLQSNETNALILGSVDDITKAVIPKAKVMLVNQETKQGYQAQTDGEGKYQISNLQSGAYTIIIEFPGFTRFIKEGIQINNGEALQLNVTLQIGSVGGAAFLPENATGLIDETRNESRAS